MADFLIHATISNLIVSAFLAGLAWAFQQSARSVVIANLLWTIVLIKMLTLPLFLLPMIEIENLSPVVQTQESIAELVRTNANPSGLPLSAHGSFASGPTPVAATGASLWIRGMILAWIAVSTILLIVSLVRVVRFEFLLRHNSVLAPNNIKKTGLDLSIKMGLRRNPMIVVSNAHIAPFVWWLGGRPRIIISSSAGKVLEDEELQMVLAHEMAHLHRRDHWIRWIEFFAGIIAWWNPVLWWSRRHLRMTEEVACDELVIEKLRLARSDYASTLLNMAELLSTSTTRPPAVASGINSGGLLEQRLTKIMSRRNITNPVWLRPAIMLFAIAVVPWGLVYAQDYEAVERRLGGAVESGELTIDQAKIMLNALKQAPSKRNDLGMQKHRFMEMSREIEAAVKDGKVSKQDAEKKLIALRKKMFRQGDSEDRSDGEMEERKRKYMAVAREVEEAVRDGKVSKKDAEKKLNALRKEMFRRDDSTDREQQ